MLQERAELKEQEAGVLIDLLNYLGEHDKAAPILERTEFLIWENAPEGLLSYHRLYKDTYKGMARQALAAKDYDRAEWALEKCLHMEKRYEEKFAELYFYMGLFRKSGATSPGQWSTTGGQLLRTSPRQIRRTINTW